ncbi:hypothetical protein TESS_TESS_00547 [Tessaracoccus sp. O5.2]|uniref:hypothetical protein n=1 Tax=Tessaracoccus sp. O5.2 TaxID=3157622 RepID=UPI0035E83BF6
MGSRVSAVVLAILALAVTACADDGSAPSAPPVPATSSEAQPSGEVFTGEVNTEEITVGPQTVRVPVGIRLPEDSLVTSADEVSVMVADEDPAAVLDAVRASAEESAYEVFATPSPDTTVWVGNGNAVVLMAIPSAQILTWGPESMAEALAQPQG